MKITEFNADKKLIDTVLLTWVIIPGNQNSTTKIYRKLNDADTFKIIAETKSTAYIDKSALIGPNRFIVYKISVDGFEKEAVLDSHSDPYIYEVAATHIFVLNEGRAGVKVNAFCESAERNHCSECWSEVQQKVFKTNCSTCDGSGWLYGYKGPIELYISMGNQRESASFEGTLERKKILVQAWTGNIPILEKYDIIIKNKQERYIVAEPPVYTRMVPEENDADFIVKQQLLLELLPPENHAYALVVS